jgi:hypothetical protein
MASSRLPVETPVKRNRLTTIYRHWPGPIFYRRLMTSEPLDPHRVGDLIDMVLGP